MSSLNVIALVSGGKDSYFSMLHCVSQGHRIVALANLHPRRRQDPSTEPHKSEGSMARHENTSLDELEPDGMDSFMYQTAGHTLVPAQAQALELPLYRRVIMGSALETSRDYHYRPEIPTPGGHQDSEETECLTILLHEIIAKYPEVNAICSGAILSSYQRTRIESVAVRLGLVPLSFLWQYPVLPESVGAALLDDMCRIGLEVRLVKLASSGVDESMLWSDLMSEFVRSKLERSMSKYGGNILGEGGEYETLVLCGPSPIWKKRLTVHQSLMQKCTDGESSSLLFSLQSVVLTAITTEHDEIWLSKLRRIPLWDSHFLAVQAQMTDSEYSNVIQNPARTNCASSAQAPRPDWHVRENQQNGQLFMHLDNMYIRGKGASSASEQMSSLNKIIIARLRAVGRHPKDIVLTTIILRSVAKDFAKVNAVYGELFDSPNPPARVTIASELPEGVNIMLSVSVNLGSKHIRDGLHVQSRSYWAPANIGPYSQAIRIKLIDEISLIFVSGQIPLVPATMTALHDAEMSSNPKNPRSVHIEDTCLSLQHMWRIGKQMGVGWWTGAIVFVSSDDKIDTKMRSIFDAWKKIHDVDLWTLDDIDENLLDPWDAKHGNMKSYATGPDEGIQLPDFEKRILKGKDVVLPGIFGVEVMELPRKCAVEWQGIGVSHSSVSFESTQIHGLDAISCCIRGTDHRFSFIGVRESDNFNGTLRDLICRISCETNLHMTIYTNQYWSLGDVEGQIIPCKSVWRPSTMGAVSLAAGIVLHSSREQGEDE